MTTGPGDPGEGPTGDAGTVQDLGGAGPAIAVGGAERYSAVLALREQGRSFANIARALGLEG
ncbi:MAG TPA: hypothetical protein VME46_09290 [Acidimicrobiales bacterium]|nr:hypothetical protein [Acidimicrobiales bacterium]